MTNKKLYGKLQNGNEVYLYTLRNKLGSEVKIIEYGATIVSLKVPDRNGKIGDVVLGYDMLEDYINGNCYFGAVVGRYANRIGKGKFSLDGREYQLAINDGENHLHGGINGFNKVMWKGVQIESHGGEAIKFTYISQDTEEGYPGELMIEVIYSLTNNNELKIDYSAITDKPTIANLTHHSYFNLTGSFQNTILEHEIMIDADSFTPVDKNLITTGELTIVENTPMDFRTPTKIGKRISDNYEQLFFGKGYDHNWVLNNYDSNVNKIANIFDPVSGRVMELLTDQPGLQFYSGNFLDGTSVGKNGEKYNYRTGLCLETQFYPDSPNKLGFPSARLNPGETYKQTTIYKFSTK